MEDRRYLGRFYGRGILLALMAAVLFAGCQTAPYGPRGGNVSPQERIALPASGEQQGKFETRDLLVDYRINRNGDDLNIAGTLVYADYLKVNFGRLLYFNLAVTFIDPAGNVLGSKGLSTAAREVIPDRVPFRTSLKLPPETTSIAFNYRGEAISPDSDGSSTTYFWHYPVK